MAKILVADDEAPILDLVRQTLAGHTVVTAANGKDALARIRSEMPDLIVLDIDMPGMDGLAVCKAVKLDPNLRRIPVLMLTGHSAFGATEDSFSVRADDYISKPFSTRILAARINELLKKKQPPAGA
jgi:CheY-like chemotaxis protein